MPAKASKKAKTAKSAKVVKRSSSSVSNRQPFYADMQNMLIIASVMILFIVLVMVLSSTNVSMQRY